MKNIEQFNTFLKDTVNLNQTRIDKATTAIKALTKFLKDNDNIKDKFISVTPQGSYRHQTIIKPPTDNNEFDVDLLFKMKEIEDFEPKDYLILIADEFKKSDRYKEKVDTTGKSRCVTIDYADDFHVDIVPSIDKDGSSWVMNRKDNTYEKTDGDGYSEWFNGRNKKSKGFLKKVVRLIKYLRDIKSTFSAKSVLLTTLLGQQVENSDSDDDYSDVPTALNNIVQNLDSYLQSNSTIPKVTNPILPEEDLNRHWNQDKYNNFRKKFHSIATNIKDAFEEEDENTSLEKWQDIFGSDFPSSDHVKEEALEAISSEEFQLGDTSHCQKPKWIENKNCVAKIDCFLYNSSGKKRLWSVRSSQCIIEGYVLKFKCITDATEPFEVFWQVVNTGEEAEQDHSSGGLRGDFFKGHDLLGKLLDNQIFNWEGTRYKGKHWIQCFVIKDGYLVAQSNRFYVNISKKKKKSKFF